MGYAKTFLAAFSILVLALAAGAQERRVLRQSGEFIQESRPPRGPQAGRMISLEIVFADVGAAAGGRDVTAAQILDLEKQGKLASVTRIKLSLVENQQGSVQFGEAVPLVTGRQSFGGRGSSAVYTTHNVGTTIAATSRVDGDGTILVELSAERSSVAASQKPAADDGAAAEPEPQKILQTTFRTNIRVANGAPLMVGGQHSAAGNQSASAYLVLTASLAEGAKAAAIPAADGAEAMIKVFPLANARAADLAKAIRPILEGQPIVLAVDERTNSIIAQGSAEQLDIARALITRLDAVEAAAAPGARTQTPPKFFALHNAQASDIVRVMRSILEGHPVTIGVDERSNSIIVSAAEKEMEVVAALLQRLDEPAANAAPGRADSLRARQRRGDQPREGDLPNP